MMVPLLYMYLSNLPNNFRDKNSVAPAVSKTAPISSRLFPTLIFKNTGFLFFAMSFCCYGLGTGAWGGLLFIYVEHVLFLGEDFAFILMIAMSFSICMIRIWQSIANYLGKQPTYAAGLFLAMIGIWFMTMLSPGSGAFKPLLVSIVAIYGGLSVANIMAPSILSDIIDNTSSESGGKLAASYFSIYSLVAKVSAGFGAAAGLALAGYFGFDLNTTERLKQVGFGMQLSIGYLPIIFLLLSISLMIKTSSCMDTCKQNLKN